MRLEGFRRKVGIPGGTRPNFETGSLRAAGYAVPNTGLYSVGEWNDADVKVITYTPDQNNVCNDDDFFYVVLSDEWGADSILGNRYLGMNITWNLSEVRP